MTDKDDGSSEPCVPEWCELGTEPHDETCPNHRMTLTKAQFVDAMQAAAEHALDIQSFIAADSDFYKGMDHRELVVTEVREAATCRAGIGSCGRGWCRHS